MPQCTKMKLKGLLSLYPWLVSKPDDNWDLGKLNCKLEEESNW